MHASNNCEMRKVKAEPKVPPPLQMIGFLQV